MSSDLANRSRAQQRIVEGTMYDNSGARPLAVPGFGYPIGEQLQPSERFRHGVDDFRQGRLVAREIAMLGLMDAITDKLEWERKVMDEAIVAKWRAEALEMTLMSERTWEWCLREVREKAGFLEGMGFVTTFETGSVCAKSDGWVEDGLREELVAGVRPLLEVEEKAKDWHPGSNEQVLNLVHPSLFPLVYGRTQVLEHGHVGLIDCLDFCGQGEVPPEQIPQVKQEMHDRWRQEEDEVRFSSRFQWLPAEVKFKGKTGTDVEITSYINNLLPAQHIGLYSTISKFISKAIPMWNEVLVKGDDGRIPPRIKVWDANIEPPEEPDLIGDADDVDGTGFKEAFQKVLEYMSLPDIPDMMSEGDEDGDEKFGDDSWVDEADTDDLRDAVSWKYRRVRQILHPEPGDSIPYDEWKSGKTSRERRCGYGGTGRVLDHEYQEVQLEQEFREQGLQVIVKLASIELTPEKSKYKGGDWHLEGMMNEHIVGTAIYYYDVDNVTESRIDFRMEARLDDEDLMYEQSDHVPLATVFGTESMMDEPAVQILGSMLCREGRMLAFPNTLQHRVQPFKLADPTRSGHRRFLVLWLVDPHYRIISTVNVPPQQHDWIAPETIDKVLAGRDLAAELEDMIKEHTDEYPMSLKTAKELRLELMEERTKLMPTVEGRFESYNLCEH